MAQLKSLALFLGILILAPVAIAADDPPVGVTHSMPFPNGVPDYFISRKDSNGDYVVSDATPWTMTLVDTVNNCQYIIVKVLNSVSITPRLGENGKPLCSVKAD